MKIVSIDVGIKNLALCLLEKPENEEHFRIIKWDTINLSQTNTYNCIDCNKPAKYTKNSKCYCLKHAKKQPFKIPCADLKPAFINKQKINNLYELVTKYNIPYEKPIKKQDLICTINEYTRNTCFEPIQNLNASKVNLVTIGRNIQLKLDAFLHEHISSVDLVLIENQISPIANRMKTIQGMIAQYFIMRNNDINIDFVSSANKLKGDKVGGDKEGEDKVESLDEPKPTDKKYRDRKVLGIQRCLELISQNSNYQEWLTFFTTHTKKDDLADAFLQGMWYINK